MKLQEIKEIANDTGVHAERGYHLKNFANQIVELDRQQRPWVGLTDKEMLECLKAVDVATAVNLLMSQYEMPPTFKVYAKAIEAKLKEKNNG